MLKFQVSGDVVLTRRKLLSPASLSPVLTHPVHVVFVQVAQFSVKFDFKVEIQITIVLGVWFHGEYSKDVFTLFHSQIIVEVKHGLLPMGVRGIGRSAKTDPLVTFSKFNGEKCDQSVHIIVTANLENKCGMSEHG